MKHLMNQNTFHRRLTRGIPSSLLFFILMAAAIAAAGAFPFPGSVPAPSALPLQAKESKKIHLVLDPGHGGSQPGAEAHGVLEKDLNLTIAEYLKEELESSYKGVRVSLTRDGDVDVDLKERVRIAKERNADMLISLHNNARGERFEYKDGFTVLTAQGNYKPDLALIEQEMACCILSELDVLDLNNRGILLRDSETGDTYEDGSIADYYAIIRAGINLDLPAIIVEHAFLDDDHDFEQYLSSDEKLKELALADARGIAAYYGLTPEKGGEKRNPPKDVEVTLHHVYDDNPEHNKKTVKVFFPSGEKNANKKDQAEGNTCGKPVTEGNTGGKPVAEGNAGEKTGSESNQNETPGEDGTTDTPAVHNSSFHEEFRAAMVHMLGIIRACF